MKAVAVTAVREVGLIELDRPEPGPGEVLVRLRACALCTWEQRVYSGINQVPFPAVGGHEAAGEIAALGARVDPAEFPLGARVGVRVIGCCYRCRYCRRGQHNLCVRSRNLRLNGPQAFGLGGLAEYLTIEAAAIWRFPDDIPFEQIALNEPLACVINSVDKGAPRLGDDVVVIGGGFMGVLHVLVSKLTGARVILSEPDASRRDFARSLGCDIAIDPSAGDVREQLAAVTGGGMADVVYNTTAVPALTTEAIGLLAPLGRCVVFSSQHPDAPVTVSPNALHNSEVVVTGAVNPSISSFDRAASLIGKRLLDLAPLISAIHEKDHAQEAFEAARRPDTYRVLIRL